MLSKIAAHKKQKRGHKDLFFVNGASNGIRLEKYCVEFAEMTIHETELMKNVLRLLKMYNV